MVFSPIASHKNAFMDSNHSSNISWSYKFCLFFRPLHVHCWVDFSKMRAICWPAILEVRTKTTTCFNISMLFYPILASIYIKISWDRSWNFALSRDKKLHILGHGGVSYKKKLQWQKPPKKKKKKRLCSLFSERVDLNMRSKTNPELEFCKKNSAICTIFDIRCY